MLENYGRERTSAEGRGRRSASAVLSLGIFGLLAAGVGAAMTTHHMRMKAKAREMEVTFDALPQPRAPKPVMVAAPTEKKKAAKPKKLSQLTEIPDARPEEAEGELAEAQDTGPIDGVEEVAPAAPAVAQAAPPAPIVVEPPPERRTEQERESVEQPIFLGGCRAPEIPEALHAQAETIKIEVGMLIGADGRVKRARVLQSHALVPDKIILECAAAQTFTPARLSDGTAVPYPFRQRFVFKPAQA